MKYESLHRDSEGETVMNRDCRPPVTVAVIPWVILWFLAAGILAGALLLMYRHETRQYSELLSRWEEAWRNRLPLLQQRLSRVVLVEEQLIGVTTGITTLDRISVQRIVHRMERRFGNRVRYVLSDLQGTILAAKGYQPDMVRLLKNILVSTLSFENLEPTGAVFRAAAIGAFSDLFPNAEAWSVRMDNWTDVSPVTFGWESGMTLYSLLPAAHRFDFSRRKWKRNPEISQSWTSPPFSGGLFAFVPWKTLDIAWLRHTLQRYPGINGCRVVIGRSGKTISAAGLPTKVQTDLCQGISHRNLGIVCGDGWFAGFIRIPSMPGQIILMTRRAPNNPTARRLATAFAGSLAILFLLAIALSHTARSSSGGSPTLAGKFLLLLMLAVFIPTLGFVRITMTVREEMHTLAREGEFKQLEERLQKAEVQHGIKMSDYCADLKRFLAWIDSGRSLPTILEIRAWIEAHPQLKFNLAYFVSPQGTKPLVIEQSQAHQSEFLNPLMNRISKSAGFYPESQGKADAAKEATEEMIMDLAHSIVGSDNLYGTFNQLDRIMTFRFYFDVGWIYLHLTPPRGRNHARFTFLTLDFDDHQEQTALEQTRKSPVTQPPSLIFAPRSRHQNLYFPDRASRINIIRRVIERVLRGGGIQKAAFSWNGRPHLLLARPMRNMDMVGIAIAPVSGSTGFDLLSVFTIGYPLLIGALVFGLFRRFYLQPVVLLHQGVDGIAAGDFSQRVPIMTDDEIGSLCKGFNTMAEGLAEKEYLRRFLSDLTMSAVKSDATSQSATRTGAAILFSDIRGFTGLSEKHPPEAIVTMLNRYFTLMEEAIEAQGGSIEKFIGDAIMAVFLPMHGRPHPSLRAIKAAAQMREALSIFNRDRSAAGLFEISTGIGIASGEVLLGALGRPDGRRDFTVTGPTVNLAAGMEKRSKEGAYTKVILCSTTSRHLASRRLSQLPLNDAEPAWELIG